MPNRVERLAQLADQLSNADGHERKFAGIVRAAAGTLSENRLNEDLANEVDDFFIWLRAQGLLDEGQLVAEASALLRCRQIHAQQGGLEASSGHQFRKSSKRVLVGVFKQTH